VVAYCRVSTLEQKRRGYGIDIQVRDVQAFAERQGFLVVRFYRDEAESGVKEDRRQLRRLLRDCRAGRVGSVVLPSLDRLSRNVLIADMPTYNSKDRKDVLIRQIREAIAEENRKDIIERLWKGRQERVRRGLLPGGTVPYGFRRNGKTLEIDEAEAQTVKAIFELAEQRHGAGTIAQRLSEQGAVRRNGQPWARRRVDAILARLEFYRNGVVHYGISFGKNIVFVLLGQ
jgi:site-specific DNA recombinase